MKTTFPDFSSPVDGGFCYYQQLAEPSQHAMVVLWKEFPNALEVMQRLHNYLLKCYDGEENGQLVELSIGEGVDKFTISRGVAPDTHFYIKGPTVDRSETITWVEMNGTFPHADYMIRVLFDELVQGLPPA